MRFVDTGQELHALQAEALELVASDAEWLAENKASIGNAYHIARALYKLAAPERFRSLPKIKQGA